MLRIHKATQSYCNLPFSMVLNRVRLTEPATGDKNTAKIRSRDRWRNSQLIHKARNNLTILFQSAFQRGIA